MCRINWLISLSGKNSIALPVSLFVVFLSLATLSGCGYSLMGQGSFLPEHIKSIYIPEFQNRTPKFELEKVIAEKIEEQFLSRGGFNMVNSEAEADATLIGIVTEYKSSPKSINEDGRATSYAIRLVVDIKFKDIRNKKILFEDSRYSVTEEYQLTESDEDFLDQEEFAIEEAVNKLSEALISAILEGF